MMFRIICCLLLLVPSAWAGDPATNPSVDPLPPVNIAQWLISCLLIIGLMFGLMWFLKKARIVPGSNHGLLQVVAVISVSAHERVMVVRAASSFYLLGVTAQNVTVLAQLPPEDVTVYLKSGKERKANPFFAKKFAEAIQQGVPNDVSETQMKAKEDSDEKK